MSNLTGAEKTGMGKAYLLLAIQYGKIKLTKGLCLFSATGLKAEGLKLPSGKPFPINNDFYFEHGNIITDCYGPEHIIDFINHVESKIIELPIVYRGAGINNDF